MTATKAGAYGVDDDIVDYVLGITFEIWEQGRVDLIDQYYGPDTLVYSLDGITRGSKTMIASTRAMLAAFPDRLLLADDVICSGETSDGYSSHRVLSPMTNRGDSAFGRATGKRVQIMNMADCVVENGVVTLEWLARDNLALVRQLEFDALDAAKVVAAKQTTELRNWFSAETERLHATNGTESAEVRRLMEAMWISGDKSIIESNFAEYAVLHRSPVELHSGRPALMAHFAELRKSFKCDAAIVDHVCSQAVGPHADHLAIRWAVCGHHRGEYQGIAATGKPIYIMGVTHRRVVAGRIAVEWTVFDSLAVMAQLL